MHSNKLTATCTALDAFGVRKPSNSKAARLEENLENCFVLVFQLIGANLVNLLMGCLEQKYLELGVRPKQSDMPSNVIPQHCCYIS
jgi:hypothetical protein